MSDSFSVRGKVSVILEEEIEIPEEWEDLSEQERREAVAEQFSSDFHAVEADSPLIEEAVETAEEMYNESAE